MKGREKERGKERGKKGIPTKPFVVRFFAVSGEKKTFHRKRKKDEHATMLT
jgi:hypothetical protein